MTTRRKLGTIRINNTEVNTTKHQMNDGRTPNNGQMGYLHGDVKRLSVTGILKQNLPEQGFDRR